jgi:hypothetical protein
MMLLFVIRLALAIDLGLNAVAAVLGAPHVMLVDPALPLGQIAQLGVLLVAAVVTHEIVEGASPIVKRAWMALLRRWNRR